MRSLFLGMLLFSINLFSMETDFELIKSRLDAQEASDFVSISQQLRFDDSMPFAFNQLFLNAYSSGRQQIIDSQCKKAPFLVVIGATRRDGVVLRQRLYLQPNNESRTVLFSDFGNVVFPHTIGEFCEVVSKPYKVPVPAFYANNVFNAMPLRELKSNFAKIYDALTPDGILLITADLRPELKHAVDMLVEKYPDIWPIPLVENDHGAIHKKSKIVLVPRVKIPGVKSVFGIYQLDLALALNPKEAIQENKLLKLAKEHAQQWKIIDLEEFYAETLTTALRDVGFVSEFKDEIYFAECARVAKFLHPKAPQWTDLRDFAVNFISDNFTTVRLFYADSHSNAFAASIEGPTLVNFPTIDQSYIMHLRNSGKTLCGVQIQTIVARKKK